MPASNIDLMPEFGSLRTMASASSTELALRNAARNSFVCFDALRIT